MHELRTTFSHQLSGNGLCGSGRDWLGWRGNVSGLEIADSHIIGDVVNLGVSSHLYRRDTRSEVTDGYVVAEVFYTALQIAGTRLPG